MLGLLRVVCFWLWGNIEVLSGMCQNQGIHAHQFDGSSFPQDPANVQQSDCWTNWDHPARLWRNQTRECDWYPAGGIQPVEHRELRFGSSTSMEQWFDQGRRQTSWWDLEGKVENQLGSWVEGAKQVLLTAIWGVRIFLSIAVTVTNICWISFKQNLSFALGQPFFGSWKLTNILFFLQELTSPQS